MVECSPAENWLTTVVEPIVSMNWVRRVEFIRIFLSADIIMQLLVNESEM